MTDLWTGAKNKLEKGSGRLEQKEKDLSWEVQQAEIYSSQSGGQVKEDWEGKNMMMEGPKIERCKGKDEQVCGNR